MATLARDTGGLGSARLASPGLITLQDGTHIPRYMTINGQQIDLTEGQNFRMWLEAYEAGEVDRMGQPVSGTNVFTSEGDSRREAMLQDLVNSYTEAYQSALQQNEQRYSDILAGYGQMRQTADTYLTGLGEAARTDIDRRYQAQASSGQQMLADRGLYNSTLGPATALAAERQRSQATTELNEALSRERLGYDTSITGGMLDFMERRTDTYPDADMLLNLIGQYGAQGSTLPNIDLSGLFQTTTPVAATAGTAAASNITAATNASPTRPTTTISPYATGVNSSTLAAYKHPADNSRSRYAVHTGT